jgi:hypothetical protein
MFRGFGTVARLVMRCFYQQIHYSINFLVEILTTAGIERETL